MAGRPSQKRSLNAWMNGDLVGTWQLHPHSGSTFSYAPSWLEQPHSRPLSLSLPTTQGTDPFTGLAVGNYFDNLLPDSDHIRKRLAARFGARSTRSFDIIEKIGRDCVGAVMLLPEGEEPTTVRTIDAEPVDEAGVERLLDEAIAAPGPGLHDEDGLRISLAGAQEKTALLYADGTWCKPHGATATTHILKLPLGEVGTVRADFSTSVENEWLCARLARAFGLNVAECEMAQFGRHRVLVVTRFDRKRFDGWIARLPQEDFCQVFGIPAEQKYESRGGPGMADILDKLRGSTEAEKDRRHFLAAQLFFWLLAAPDGHAKNFSIFLEPHNGFRSTPLYDVLSGWPVIGKSARQFQWQKVKLAMALRCGNAHYRVAEIRREHWNQVAKANALGIDFEETIAQFLAHAPKAVEQVAASLPKSFPAEVCDPIFDGVLEQAKRLKDQSALEMP